MNCMSFRFFKVIQPITILLVAAAARAQSSPPLPKIASASVKATITPIGPLFLYAYQISNDPASTAGVWRVSLDITRPTGGVLLSNIGLVDGPCLLASVSQQVLTGPKAPQVVPVGFNAPARWLCGPSRNGTGQWSATTLSVQVTPGQVVAGFQLNSPGLPAIRRMTLEPQIDVETLNVPLAIDDSPSEVGKYLGQVASIHATASVSVVTVGPTAPPSNFLPVDFLSTIISEKEQALHNGWIDNSGIAISLDAKLNAAQASLQQGDNNTAANQLNALLNEVNAQAGEHLTAEAVALLKINTQYLIGKIQ